MLGGVIQALLQAGIQPQAPQERSAAGAFAGRTVAFTGALQSMPRAKGQQAVQALGGTVAKSITKKVNLVIAGEDAGSKLDKARDLGIEIWDEQRFLPSIFLSPALLYWRSTLRTKCCHN
ncbi:DNA ligase [bioreactor metagenome]|uniref:DNA ligase n=1 Tax=bioreactor metagenome TaxID=1076179 RepID=A0A645ID67_9ZZZZ